MFLKSLGVNTQLVHAVGHSLGAHVVGHFGRTIQTEGYDKIIRMTGKGIIKTYLYDEMPFMK